MACCSVERLGLVPACPRRNLQRFVSWRIRGNSELAPARLEWNPPKGGASLRVPLIIQEEFRRFVSEAVLYTLTEDWKCRTPLMAQRDLIKETRSIDRGWAILFARLVLGLIFFMAGVMKVFQLGPLEHARKYFLPFADTFLPVWSLWAVGVVIPFVELIAGAMVIVGLRIRVALVALGFVLAIVTFGHLLKEPLYEFHTHVIPRLALLLFVFLLPRDDDRFSLDYCLKRWKEG